MFADFRAWLANASGRETHPYAAAFPVTAASCPPAAVLAATAPPPCPLVALEAFLNAPTWEADAEADGGAVARAPYGARWQAEVGLARGRLHFLALSFALQLRPSAPKRAAEAETTRYKSQYEALEASTAQELADLRALVARMRKDLAAARDDNAKLQVCLLALSPPKPMRSQRSVRRCQKT